jgi:DNA-directed RNA polymerase specialized sigma24 family protein
VKRRLPAGLDRLPTRVRLAAALEALEPRERHVLALRLVERMSPLETAGTLKMSVRQVDETLADVLARVADETGLSRSALRRAA